MVSNPGDVDLTGITLTDSLVADLIGGRLHHPDTLAAGASFPCDYSLVAVRGTTTNTATADSAETDPPVTDSTTVVGLRPPLIAITKGVRSDPAADFVSDLVVPVGTTVTYRITVTNVGDVAVDGITLVDDHSVLAGCAIPPSLAPNASFSCTYSAVVVAGTTTNTATADSAETDPPVQRRPRVTGTPVVSPPPLPGLSITKRVRTDPGKPLVASLTVVEGTIVFYEITVTNTGQSRSAASP